jgi:hypothetical protein
MTDIIKKVELHKRGGYYDSSYTNPQFWFFR